MHDEDEKTVEVEMAHIARGHWVAENGVTVLHTRSGLIVRGKAFYDALAPERCSNGVTEPVLATHEGHTLLWQRGVPFVVLSKPELDLLDEIRTGTTAFTTAIARSAASKGIDMNNAAAIMRATLQAQIIALAPATTHGKG